MKNAMLLIIGFCLCLATAESASAQAQTYEERQAMYMEYLTEQGFRPEIDRDGDIKFRREGNPYYILVDREDPQFFYLLSPGIWAIENEAELMKALVAADYATRRSKVAVVHLGFDETELDVSVQLYVDKPEDFKPLFGRCFAAIDTAIHHFDEKIKE